MGEFCECPADKNETFVLQTTTPPPVTTTPEPAPADPTPPPTVLTQMGQTVYVEQMVTSFTDGQEAGIIIGIIVAAFVLVMILMLIGYMRGN